MSMKTIRRLAAKIFKSGESRVRILDAKRAGEALTSEDVKGLIAEKIVIMLPKQGVSRGNARDKKIRQKKGRRRGPGSRKGSHYAGTSAKDMWMRKVRAQRKVLRSLKNTVSKTDYRSAYRMIKGNAFSDKKHLAEHLKSLGKKEGEMA